MTEQPHRKVPSLLSLALGQAPVRSPNSRAALDQAAQAGHLDLATMELVNDAELSHLQCRGRVDPKVDVYNGVMPHRPLWNVNLPQSNGRNPSELDAQLQSYYRDTEEFVVRLDAWQNPSFWAECRVPLAQLQQWLAAQGIRMEWSRMDDDDDNVEVIENDV